MRSVVRIKMVSAPDASFTHARTRTGNARALPSATPSAKRSAVRDLSAAELDRALAALGVVT